MSFYNRFQKQQRKADEEAARCHTEWLASDESEEAKADMATERDARNSLSYDAEAFDEMVRDDLMGRS